MVILYSVPSQINRKSMWPMKLDPSSRGPGVLSSSPKGALWKPKEEGYPHSNELPHSNPTRGWVSTPHRLRRHLGRCGVRRQPGHPAQLQPCPLFGTDTGSDIKTGRTASSHWPASLTRSRQIWSLFCLPPLGEALMFSIIKKNFFFNFTHSQAGTP